MFKNRYSLFFLIFSLFFSNVSNAEEVKKTKEIFMVVWNGCDEACQGFSDAFAEAKYPVNIRILDAKKDKKNISLFIQQTKEKAPDLLATWGTQISLQMLGTSNDLNALRYVTGIPAVFMAVAQPVESGLVSGTISQGRAITGVSQSVSVSEQLQSARQYIPFKRLGVLYNPKEINSVTIIDRLKLYAPMMNYDVIDIPVPLDDKDLPDPQTLPRLVSDLSNKKIDLFYLGPDAFLNEHRDVLLKETMLYNIPVLSFSEGPVRNAEALFAFVNRYYVVGYEAGQKALQILKDGIPAYDIPITSPQRFLTVVNLDVAEKLSLYPPLSFIQNADLIKKKTSN